MRCSSSARRRRAWWAAAAALAAFALSGCQVEVRVGVDAHRDGSGQVQAEVALDPAAARRIPDLADRLEVDDLRDAGWKVEGPVKTDGGGAVVTATKPFADAAGFAAVMAELSGEDGPFRDFRLRRSRSFLKTTTAFGGTVDLSSGLAGFGDDALTERLGGEPLGVDEAELERQVGAVLEKAFRVRVAVRLPGDIEANTVGDLGNGAIWTPRLGEKAGLEARAESWNATNLTAAAVAAVSVLAFAWTLRRALRR